MSQGLDRFIQKMLLEEKDMLSIDDLSKITGLKKSFFYNVKSSENPIPFIKIGNKIRFFKLDVVNWLKICSYKKENKNE